MYELRALRSSLEDAAETSKREFRDLDTNLLDDLLRLLSMLRHSVQVEILAREYERDARERL